MRKMYIDGHRTGSDVLIAAEAAAYAARTAGANVVYVDGMAIVVQGDAPAGMVADVAEAAGGLDVELERRAA